MHADRYQLLPRLKKRACNCTPIAKFKPCLKIVTVSTVSIGAKPAKVTIVSITEFCWVYKDILDLHALFFSLSALAITVKICHAEISQLFLWTQSDEKFSS